MSKDILKESFNSKFDVLTDKPKNVLKRFKMKLSDWKPNRNGRVYPRELWERVINSDYTKEMINSHALFGELDHPEERLEVSLQQISHAINDMWLENDGVYGIIDVLPTENGKILSQLIEYGSEIGISSRGTGSVSGNTVDPNSYQFVTFDIVMRPSVEAAKLDLRMVESVNLQDTLSVIDKYHIELNESQEEMRQLRESFVEASTNRLLRESALRFDIMIQDEDNTTLNTESIDEMLDVVETNYKSHPISITDNLLNKTSKIYDIIDYSELVNEYFNEDIVDDTEEDI